MARKPVKIAPNARAEIDARIARGESPATIKAAVRGAPSKRTLERMKQQARRQSTASITAAQPSPAASIVDEVPDDVPEGTPLEDLNRWIARCETGAHQAELDGNLSVLASLAAKAATLLALRHKQTPPPKPDPNENPDYKALAAQGRERLEKLARGIFGLAAKGE